MKLLRQTARRRVWYWAAALGAGAFAAAALALAGLLPLPGAAVPEAHAQGLHGRHDPIARIQVRDVTAYRGTNTHIAIERYDAAGELIPITWRETAGVHWQAADAAARAAIDDENGYGSVFDGFIWIPIRSDAPAGEYTVDISTRSRGDDRVPEASTATTITVIGPPDSISARLTRTEYDPGDRIIGYATVRDADGALATFTREAEFGYGVPERCGECFWEAADRATAAALELPEGYLSSGTVRARVAAGALGGEYSIIVSHPTAGAQTLTFTVTGAPPATPEPEPTPDPGAMPPPPALPPGPASYELEGHRVIGAGRTGIFTVTGTDAAGELPNLEGVNAQVYVLVDGPGADAVSISGVTDAGEGIITLNDKGVGTFALRVANGTAPTTVGLELVGALGSAPIIRELDIGTEQPPLPDLGDAANLTLTAGTGDAAGSVTLRWTAGANADRHWIAGIKVSDWEAGNFDDIIWTRAAANDRHTVTGLDAGAEYAFTVIAGRLVNGVSEWGSWVAIERVTVAGVAAVQ